MKTANAELSFATALERSTNRLWGAHISVPSLVAERVLKTGSRRIVCILNDVTPLSGALIPKGSRQYVITVNKKLRDALQVSWGVTVRVRIRPDESAYGLPMPAELLESLDQDPGVRALFKALTLGRQRTLLYIVSSVRDPDKRIRRSLVILSHLRSNKGTIDYKRLTQELRAPRRTK